MNKIHLKLLICFIFSLSTDLLLKAQGVVGSDSCKVPTIITPNDDGSNDELRIPCLTDDNPDSELFIMNEWGDRVFFASPYRNNWRGTYKDQPLPDGTYFYIFKKTKNAQAQTGYTTIFR
ncbi:MAG: gliding motility-associated C-terminal domain-containing protein [Saprospiraceae bacterium]|nr:gliding motility-associated C-terminal domain-containing protein [Saprospiraceae bacterium]